LLVRADGAPVVELASSLWAKQGNPSISMVKGRRPITFDTSSSKDQTQWTTVSSFASRAIIPRMRAETTALERWWDEKAITHISAVRH
jgi:hypothetical protein